MVYRTFGVVASVALIAAVAPATADDETPFTAKEIPLTTYTTYLIQTYGVDAVVTESTIKGYEYQTDPTKPTPFTDPFPPTTPRTILSLPFHLASPCTNIIDAPPPAGGIKNKWCGVHYPGGGGKYYEARRDTYAFSLGSWSYTQVAVYFDCEDPADVASMTDTVKNAVC